MLRIVAEYMIMAWGPKEEIDMSDEEAEKDTSHLDASGNPIFELKKKILFSLPPQEGDNQGKVGDSTAPKKWHQTISSYIPADWFEGAHHLQPFGVVDEDATVSAMSTWLERVHPGLKPFAEVIVAQGFTTVESLAYFDRDCCKELKIPMAPTVMLLKKIEEMKAAPAAAVPSKP
jgi:hypothetical protein